MFWYSVFDPGSRHPAPKSSGISGRDRTVFCSNTVTLRVRPNSCQMRAGRQKSRHDGKLEHFGPTPHCLESGKGLDIELMMDHPM